MPSDNQLFMLNIQIQNILARVSMYHAHFIAKNHDGIIIQANDLLAKYYGVDSIDAILGQNAYNLLPEKEVNLIMSNDTTVINGKPIPYLFYETCINNECMSIKTQLLDSCNNIVGVGAINFYFYQTVFKDIVTLINELFFLTPITSSVKHIYVSNIHQFDRLTPRERDCVNCLSQGKTCKEIARRFNISYRTVEKHVENVKNKLKCYRRSDIVSKIFEYR